MDPNKVHLNERLMQLRSIIMYRKMHPGVLIILIRRSTLSESLRCEKGHRTGVTHCCKIDSTYSQSIISS
jgi:hypothetical protein